MKSGRFLYSFTSLLLGIAVFGTFSYAGTSAKAGDPCGNVFDPRERQISVYESAEAVAQAAAVRFIDLATQAIASQGHFSVALAGGSTPESLYSLLASDPYRSAVDWTKVHFFFGDERCVPPTHSDSNFAMAWRTLLSRLEIPSSHIHRVLGEGDPGTAARTYEEELRSFFRDAEWPRFDLVLLGMGNDGHTASLFPESPALDEKATWVAAVRVPGQKIGNRLTLTLPAINHAKHVLFQVAGEGKAPAFAAILCQEHGTTLLPAARVRSQDGKTEWLVSSSVASDALQIHR